MAAILQKKRRQRQRQYPFELSIALLLLIGVASLLPSSHSFRSVQIVTPSLSRSKASTSTASSLRASLSDDEEQPGNSNRREILSRAATAASTWCFATAMPSMALASPEDDVKETRTVIAQAKGQLETVPALLKEEKWDSVRSVLMDAPLRDCWSKSTPILKKYAEALGETPKGDELAALEGREELLQHLRFLDMAVDNNVFNPISTEGTTGASKALIDSYYNDPTREFDASMKAINDLLELSN